MALAGEVKVAAAGEEKITVDEVLQSVREYCQRLTDLTESIPADIAMILEKIEQFKSEDKLGTEEHLELEKRRCLLDLQLKLMKTYMTSVKEFLMEESRRLEEDRAELEIIVGPQQQRRSNCSA